MGLSEESKDDLLLAKIKATKRKIDIMRNGALLGAIVFTVLGIYWLYLAANPSIRAPITLSNILLCSAAFGAFLSLVTIIQSIRYNGRNKSYYKELTIIPEQLASSIVCPKCKKNLPKEYDAVCIFCGFDLGLD
jgi:hypothetical protein